MPELEYDKLEWWEKIYWYFFKMFPLAYMLFCAYAVKEIFSNVDSRRAYLETLPWLSPVIACVTAALVIRAYRPWRDRFEKAMRGSWRLRSLYMSVLCFILLPSFGLSASYASWLERRYQSERLGQTLVGGMPDLFKSSFWFVLGAVLFCFFVINDLVPTLRSQREASRSPS